MAANPDQYELHYEDATHVETNPSLGRVWHRVGQQPVLPAAGTNRRLTVFGSVDVLGRGRVEVLGTRADSAGFGRYLAALDVRHDATQRKVILVMDNGSCHTSRITAQALAERADWLEVVFLSRYSPQLNPKEREWRILKRDHRSHLAPTLQTFVEEMIAGLHRLGGERCDVINQVDDWWINGQREEPVERTSKGATDRKDNPKPKRSSKNLPAST